MKNREIKYIIGIMLIIGLVLTGGYLHQVNQNEQAKQQASAKVEELKKNGITYKGKNETTALVLLEKNAKIVTKGTGKNAFVTTIDGVEANSKNQYWAFNVNGKSATVGAGAYVTKDSETITWKLTSF